MTSDREIAMTNDVEQEEATTAAFRSEDVVLVRPTRATSRIHSIAAAAREQQQTPEIRSLSCSRCKTHLGIYTSAILQIGTGQFHRAVTIRCVCCKHDNRWAPAVEKK